MRTFKTNFSCIAFLACSLGLAAQATPPPPKPHYIVDYMKTTPGHAGDYVNLEKGVWKDIHKARIKKGVITGWFFLEVLFPSGAETEYNYVTITSVEGWDGIEKVTTGWNDVFNSLTKEQTKSVDSTEMFRTLVRTEVWTAEDAIFKNPPGSTPPKYWLANSMKVKEGKWDAYMKMEQTIAKPVHQEQIKNGHRSGWGVYSLILPWGAESKYDVVAMDYYENWSDVYADDMGAIWKKVHPTKTNAMIEKSINDTRTLGKGEVRVLIDYTQ